MIYNCLITPHPTYKRNFKRTYQRECWIGDRFRVLYEREQSESRCHSHRWGHCLDWVAAYQLWHSCITPTSFLSSTKSSRCLPPDNNHNTQSTYMSVVLPAPFCPSKAVICPAWRLKLTSLSATLPFLYFFLTWLTVTPMGRLSRHSFTAPSSDNNNLLLCHLVTRKYREFNSRLFQQSQKKLGSEFLSAMLTYFDSDPDSHHQKTPLRSCLSSLISASQHARSLVTQRASNAY